MGTIKSERWFDSVGEYYNIHEVGNKLFLTFTDFCEMVSSGRWARYIAETRLPDKREYKTRFSEAFINATNDDTAGYSVITRVGNEEVIHHFGVGMKARSKALSYVKELQL